MAGMQNFGDEKVHHHVLEVDDGEVSSRINGIELKINVRDIPVR
jgi:hypothetical protein